MLCNKPFIMLRSIFIALLLFAGRSFAQTDTTKWLRAFPVTSYMVDLNDSVKVVQVQLPEGIVIKDKQLGVLYGVYNDSHSDTVQKGYGRCHLIKGNYYYFSIGNNKSGTPVKEGDLVYTFMDKTPIYFGQLPKLAAHFIRLQDVQGNNFYDRYTIFSAWTESNEKTLIDSMMKDVRFTGQYFLENDKSMNKPITGGAFKGRGVLDVMKDCQYDHVRDFLGYMIARPRLYAGREWKLSEVFATWLVNNAPTVVKE
jgi:hypothetical protein